MRSEVCRQNIYLPTQPAYYRQQTLRAQSVNISKCCLLYNDNNDTSQVILLSTKSLPLFGQISTAVRSEDFQFLFVSKIGSDLSCCAVFGPQLSSFSRQSKCWRNLRENHQHHGWTGWLVLVVAGGVRAGCVAVGWWGDIPVL